MSDDKLLAGLETPAENEQKLIDQISKMEHKMSEDAVRAVRAALRLLDAFRDEVPSETIRGLAAAAGMEMRDRKMEEEKSMHYDDEEKSMHYDDEKRGMHHEKSADPSALLKSADLPDEVRPVIEALAKSHAQASERVGELERVLKSERDQRLMADETERVSKAYGHVPGVQATELAGVMIHLRKSSPESLKSIEGILTATEQALIAKASGAFEETGRSVSPQPGESTTWGRIEAKADDIVQKGEAPTKAQAIDHILTVEPELYQAYLAEK